MICKWNMRRKLFENCEIAHLDLNLLIPDYRLELLPKRPKNTGWWKSTEKHLQSASHHWYFIWIIIIIFIVFFYSADFRKLLTCLVRLKQVLRHTAKALSCSIIYLNFLWNLEFTWCISIFTWNMATGIRIRITLFGDSYFHFWVTPDCKFDLYWSAA